MKCFLIALLFLVLINTGLSQEDPCDIGNNVGLVINSPTASVTVVEANPVPVCARCGYLQNLQVMLVTDPSNVTYIDGGGNTIINNTNGFVITDEGLLIDDPTVSFNSGGSVQCLYDDGTMDGQSDITFNFITFNSPPITTTNNTLNYIEGDNIIITCTGNNQIDNDRYQWTLPDGTLAPSNPAQADDGLDLVLMNINRTQSGIYICTGSISGVEETVQSNVTLNIQYPVIITSFTPSNSTVIVGTTLILNCSFDGNPPPSMIAWTHNDTNAPLNVQNDPNLSQTITDTYALLEVIFANINVSGAYACGVDNGIGIDQTQFTFITVQVAPGPVATLLNDSIDQNCVTISWSYGFDGNAPITGVNIDYTATDNYGSANPGSESGSTTSDETSSTICGLQSLTTYDFTVTVNNQVSNTVGSSSPQAISVTTLPEVPDAPTLDNVTVISSTELSVEWTINHNPFIQTPIDGFEISYNIKGNSDVQMVLVTDPSAITEQIDNLLKGTVYEFSIVSGNSAGPSPSSSVIEQRTGIDPPSAVNNLTSISNPFSLCVSWTLPTDNGGQPISGYIISLWNRDQYPMENYTMVATVGADILSYTIEGLDNDTDYSVSVTATNTEGGAGGVETVNVTTGQPLPVDSQFIVSISNISAVSVMVSWTVPSNNNNSQYRIQITEEDDYYFNPTQYTSLAADLRSTVVEGLNPNTSYIIRMTRIEEKGCVRRVSEIMYFETIELDVEIPDPPTVVSGNEVVLRCLLSTGQPAPNVVWSRTNGDIPAGAIIAGNTLTIPNPTVDDSGEYICSSSSNVTDRSNAVMFPINITVQPPPSTSTTSPTPTGSPGPTEKLTEALPVWAIAVIAVGALLCILLFVVMLIVVIYCCCCRDREEKAKARYDLTKETKKTSAGNMWLDEGASGFSSIPQYNGDDADAPVGRGRTMTNDYVSATSFNTLDKKGSKERLTDVPEATQTDV